MTAAQREAAALAVAARTNAAAGEALRDYLQESTDPELAMRWELVRLLDEGRTCSCDCEYCRRVGELQAKLSAWRPCPECVSLKPGVPLRENCPACGGTGDVLTVFVGDRTHAKDTLPLTWDCGFPRWVTLPTIEDAVQWVNEVNRLTAPLQASTFGSDWEQKPTPRLRALAATPPWGVPPWGVRVADREPAEWYHEPGGWAWLFESSGWARHARNEEAFLPDVLRKYLPNSYHHTKQAAADALARGLVTFAREYKG